jgi:hypothetical protein
MAKILESFFHLTEFLASLVETLRTTILPTSLAAIKGRGISCCEIQSFRQRRVLQGPRPREQICCCRVESQDYDYKHFPSLKCNVSHKSLRAHYYVSLFLPGRCGALLFVTARATHSPSRLFNIHVLKLFSRYIKWKLYSRRARCLACFLPK